MYPTPFDYVRASSWVEAVEQLAQGGDDAHVISGGQSLVPMMMLRLASPSLLVDVGAADERTIEVRDGKLVLGALVRHVDLEHSQEVRRSCPTLSEAAAQIGNFRVRQRGTLGGSLAHGEATAELATVAVAHEADVRVLGPGGERTIPATELFVTHLTTSLDPAEVITAVEFPVSGPGQGHCFLELARRAGDFAMVEVAATVELDGEGRCESARLVVGAVTDRPTNFSDPVQALVGERPAQPAIRAAARAVAAQVEVGPSAHAGVEYRREMVAVLAGRALTTALRRAGGDPLDGDGRPA